MAKMHRAGGQKRQGSFQRGREGDGKSRESRETHQARRAGRDKWMGIGVGIMELMVFFKVDLKGCRSVMHLIGHVIMFLL